MWFFIRFFIFADPPPDKKDYQSHVRQQRQAKLLLPEVNASPSDILERTYYDVDTHAPESLDWLTVLIAQGVRHFRRARWDGSSDAAATPATAGGDVNNSGNESVTDESEDSEAGAPAVGSDKLVVLERLLNFDKLPGFVDKIRVVELDIGKNFPVFRNCKIVKRKSQSVAAAAEAAAAAAAMAGNLNGLVDEEAIAGSDYSDNEADSLLSTPRQSVRRRRSSHYRRPRPRSAATRTLSSSSTSSPSAPDILEVQMDVELKDTITLGIETRLILNFPRPGFAFLPIKLVVSVVQFSGTLKVSLRNNKNSVPETATDDTGEPSSSNNVDNSSHNDTNATSNSPSDNEAIFDDDEPEGDYAAHPSTAASGSGDPHDGGEPDHHTDEGANASAKAGPRNRLYDDAYITLSFAPNYTLRFDIQSSIGSLAAPSRLMNVDKIAQLIEHRLKQVFEERFVYPNHRKFYLPSVLPRKKPSPPEGPGKQSSQQQQQQQSQQQQSPSSQQQQQQPSSQQQQQQQSQQQQMPHHGFIIDDHTSSPRLHPRSFSSVSQLASNTALNMPPQATPPTLPLRGSNHHNYHHNYNQLVMDDESAII
ncbi:hypothetical protein D0Z00_003286 [Geotrichum galactomycetum]|uniref:Uncharacterized protein n=1 Tax=Geotrichum galactomycetum TaxID=27317 RepID=A0ACB6V1P9_9ASCO|nr:hypothetical protein D0Z00_003286 [Geotrichum candidum]